MGVITIVGYAEIVVTPTTSQFPSKLQQGVNGPLTQTGAIAEKQAARGTKAFSLMYDTISTASLGAMQPVVNVVGTLKNSLQAVEGYAHGIIKTGLLAGTAGTAIGAGLMGLGSSEASNLAQLQGTITSTGHVWSDYSDIVEGAVKTGEHYGKSAATTYDALNRVAVATQNPRKAVEMYTTILNYAATRHIDVASAAQLVAQALGGNYSRLLKSVGVNTTEWTQKTAAATSAQKAHASAVTTLQEKERALRQEQERVKASTDSSGSAAATQASQIASATAAVSSAQASLMAAKFKYGDQSPQATAAADRVTAAQARLNAARSSSSGSTSAQVSQSIALRNAHHAVDVAQKKVTETTKTMTAANKDAAPAQHDLAHWQDILAERTQSGSHSMDSFSGHLKQLGAEVEDYAAKYGNKYGPSITAVSVGILAASTIADGVRGVLGRFKTVEQDAGAAAEVTAGQIQTEAIAMGEAGLAGEVDTAQLSLFNLEKEAPRAEGALANLSSGGSSRMGALGKSVAGVAGAIGVYEAGAHGGSATSSTLMGALSGAVAGFAMGGPFGAAIGGAIGGLGALVTHFHHTRDAISETDQQLQGFSDDLKSALEGKSGPGAVKGVIGTYLTKNPATAHTLAQAGLSAADVKDYLIWMAKGSPSRYGTPSQVEGIKAVQDYFTSHTLQVQNGQGQVLETKDGKVVELLNTMLKDLMPLVQQAKDYRHVMGGHHHALGGTVRAGDMSWVGEQGPELVEFGDNGYVHPNNRIRAGMSRPSGEPGAQLAMYLLRLINSTDRQTRAIEDTPHGIARELHRGGHHASHDPMLATL